MVEEKSDRGSQLFVRSQQSAAAVVAYKYRGMSC